MQKSIATRQSGVREHHIQNHQIDIDGQGGVQAILTIPGQIDNETGFQQAMFQIITFLRLILNDPNFH